MTASPDPAIVATLQARFAQFSRDECRDDPLYVALTDVASRRPDWAGLLAAAPSTQHMPTVWLAALHDRVLELVERGERPAIADYYASVGGTRAPDAALEALFGEFIERERASLSERIATRNNQTNEIGRCAVLWPILQALTEATGHRRLALLDVGCSAGLNLGVDRWRYRYVDDATGATLATSPADRDPRAPELTCRVLAGALPRNAAEPTIVSRSGVDLKPISVDDDIELRWLRACLWPHDAVRRERFDAAVAIARTQHWPLSATTDVTAAVDDWLARLPPDVTPVIFNSWVLAYFDPPTLRRHVQHLREAIVRRGAVWISAEPPKLARAWWPDLPAAPAPAPGGSVSATDLEVATVWTVARPDGDGGIAWTLAARSHGHGRWILYEG